MPSSGSRELAKSLYDASWVYRELGFSVIPVYGDADPTQPKVAAVDWKQYQARYATHIEMYRWYFELGAQGMAFVTGRASRLLVLDFDDIRLAQLFFIRFSRLCETRIIRSAQRGLPHVYFRLPVGVTLPSRRLNGLDVQCEGRYIISHPTTIDGKQYQIIRAGMPRELTRAEVEQLQGFIEEVASFQQSAIPAPPPKIEEPTPIIPLRTPEEFRNYYLAVAPHAGRNNTLFRAALMMRDNNWSLDHALKVLTPLHISLARADERPDQREREAKATIRSAFSRPPRPPQAAQGATRGVPNSLREALLAQEQVALLRVLDGLCLHGVPAGALLTEKQIVETLKGVVGRYSVLQALKTCIKGVQIFQPADPLPSPHTPTNVAMSLDPLQEKKCLQLGVTPSDKNRGRPARRYQMPSLEALCQLLGVRWTRSDSLTQEDLQSPAKYRRGMHREFVKRRPGTYHVKLLARRLNVVDRTIQRYNHVCGVSVIPTYERYAVNMGMMHLIAAPQPYMFLEDMRGKRYPCRPEIAKRLMARRLRPVLCLQGFSQYMHPDGVRVPVTPIQELRPETQDPASVFFIPPQPPKQYAHLNLSPYTFIPDEQLPTEACVREKHESLKIIAAIECPNLKVRSFRRPLPDAKLEAAAKRLHQQVRDLVEQSRGMAEGVLSLANARRLAARYGLALLRKCQRTIHQRKNIRNYAGFVVSFLSSEANVQRMRARAAAQATRALPLAK